MLDIRLLIIGFLCCINHSVITLNRYFYLKILFLIIIQNSAFIYHFGGSTFFSFVESGSKSLNGFSSFFSGFEKGSVRVLINSVGLSSISIGSLKRELFFFPCSAGWLAIVSICIFLSYLSNERAFNESGTFPSLTAFAKSTIALMSLEYSEFGYFSNKSK